MAKEDCYSKDSLTLAFLFKLIKCAHDIDPRDLEAQHGMEEVSGTWNKLVKWLSE